MNSQDENIKNDEKKDLLVLQISPQDLAKAEELKKITPNWRRKLGQTLVAIAIPALSLLFDAESFYSDYKAGEISQKEDLPEVSYEQRKDNPFAYLAAGEPFIPVAHELQPQEGQTLDDIFKVEMAKSLFPELKVNTKSLRDPEIFSKVNEGIEKYRQIDVSFYQDLYEKFLKGFQKLNPEIKTSTPFNSGSRITSLSMSPIIAELQLARLLSGNENYVGF